MNNEMENIVNAGGAEAMNTDGTPAERIGDNAPKGTASAAMEVSDYTDPICPFDFSQWTKGPVVNAIPIARIVEKQDQYFAAHDFEGEERHLKYWLREAEAGNDARGAFFMHNEMMGLYRMMGRKEEAVREAEAALAMTSLEVIGPDSTAAATCYLNAGTVNKAFGMPEKAVTLYERARVIYERDLKDNDHRLGGLYNNMALALTDVGRYDEAVELYEKAIDWMSRFEHREAEEAISLLNLCDTLMKRDLQIVNDAGEPCSPEDPEAGLMVPAETDERIERCLDLAEVKLNTFDLPRDGDYAYMADKCAPTFEYYGREEFAAELRRRTEEIYAGN